MSEEQRAKQIQNAYWRREFGFDPQVRIQHLEEALREAVELLEMRTGWLSQDELRICRIKKAALSPSEAPEKWELEGLVLGLSELLDRAISTQGELSEREWERAEELQRQAYVLKHPEVLGKPPREEEGEDG